MPLLGKRTPKTSSSLWPSFPSSRQDNRRHRPESTQETLPPATPDHAAMGNSNSHLLSHGISIGRRPSFKKAMWDPPAYDSEDYTVPSSSETTDADPDSRYAFLKVFDIVFLVDDSSSMKGPRWREAEEAIAAIAPICTQYDDDGIDIYFLNHRPKAEDRKEGAFGYYSKVKTAAEVRTIFNKAEPRGSTHVGRRLLDILGPYLRRVRETSHNAQGIFGDSALYVKPINIIAITDGEFTDSAEEVIRDVAKDLDGPRMRVLPWQVGIQFFQIGDDQNVRRYLQRLDDELGKDQRLRDIVDTVPWRGRKGQVLDAEGILKCVLGAVNKKYDRWRVD